MTIETPTVSDQQTALDLDALFAELDAGMERLPVEALRTCQQHRELVTPRLIESIAEAVRLAREGTVRAGHAHFFALFLLTEFEAKPALPVILDLFAIPEPLLDELIGGAVTETTRRVLAVLAGDQPDLIEAMIPNRQLDDYIRWEAACALSQLVRDGRLKRSDALERLTRQLRAAVEARDSWVVTLVICELSNLNPLEVEAEIKAAYDQGLVDSWNISWKSVQRHLYPEQPESCPALAHHEPSAIIDTVAELRRWACFREEAQSNGQHASLKPIKALLSNKGDLLDPAAPRQEFGTICEDGRRVGRNDPCPCGSGKKYKKCCLRGGDGG